MNNSNSSHHQDDVVLTQSGEVLNPIDLDDNFLIITKFVCCSIGIPLNLSIAFTIVHRRRLPTGHHLFIFDVLRPVRHQIDLLGSVSNRVGLPVLRRRRRGPAGPFTVEHAPGSYRQTHDHQPPLVTTL